MVYPLSYYNTIQNNRIFGPVLRGISCSWGCDNNTFDYNLIDSATSTSFDQGAFLIEGSKYNKIRHNTMRNSGKGINMFFTQDYNNLFENNTIYDGNIGLQIGGYNSGYSGNVFLNNNIYGNSGNEIEQGTPDSNSFIYNNSFGEIRWTDLAFLNDLTTSGDLTFPGNITIGNNSAYLDSSAFAGQGINSNANITFYGLSGLGLSNPAILKDGYTCIDCHNFTALDTEPVIFSVTSWSNYTVGEDNPRPRLLIGLVSPTADTNVPQKDFFAFTVNVTCHAADCGQANVSLDPIGTYYFEKTDYGSEEDCITPNVCITRGDSQGIYNSVNELGFGGWSGIPSPVGTLWRRGTCDDPVLSPWAEVASPASYLYDNNEMLNKDLCFYLTADDLYFDIYFTSWTSGNSGGGFSYIRSNSTGTVSFTKTDYGSEEDCITPNVCITRGDSQGIYNSVNESGSGGRYTDSPSPSGTLWWRGRCDDPIFSPWMETASGASYGYHDREMLNKDLCFYLTADDLYFDIYFTNWTSGNSGGGFAYYRTELERKGLVNTTIGATPFYTNGSNPVTVSLNEGESTLITWWVNATGEINSTWEFYAYAELDLIRNETDTIDITITPPTTTEPSSYCGDGVCNNGEGCHSCSADCGSCAECSSDSDCDDDSECTEDSCEGGDCSYTTISCNDNNVCTTDSCNRNTGCEYTDNVNACSDNNACTTGDTCSAGSCTGTPINCDDDIACTVDTCAAGVCQHVSNCACLADSDCDDSNPCTSDVCTVGVCQNNATEGSCDDGDDCTDGDYCLAGSCASGVYVCPCDSDSDCDDDNTCTDERCNDATKTCEVTRLTGTSCDDDDRCTSDDTCDNGKCKGGKNICKETGCTEDWSCIGWSTCTNGKQTRSCRCSCPDNDCFGDSTESRSCTTEQLLAMSVSTSQGLNVGDVLKIQLTDENGNPITGKIILIRPDGTTVELTGDSYVVDQAGIWKIVVEKEGYQQAETEASVVENAPPAADLGSQIANAVKDIIAFITKEPVRFALLLTTIALIIGGLFFLKTRKKKDIEKL